MSINNNCCFFSMDSEKYFKSFVYENALNLMTEGKAYSLIDLKDYAKDTVEDSREFFKNLLPFRIKFCKYAGIKCCGSCTLSCRERCVHDIYTKLTMYLDAHCPRPYTDNIEQSTSLAKSIYKLLLDPYATYDQLLDMCNQVISVRHNSKIKQRMVELNLSGQDQRNATMWKLDYAPLPQYYQIGTSGKYMRKVDKQTGRILFNHWPETGLCPYCLPRVTLDRHYGKDYNII